MSTTSEECRLCFCLFHSAVLYDICYMPQWIDDHLHPGCKYSAFLALNNAFKQAFGRPVRLWYEKCCIQQDSNAMDKVALLPVFISACTTLACMYSEDWVKRLWCLSEVADVAALAPAHTRSPTPMLLFKLAVNSEVVMDGDVIVREPDLDTAQCGMPEDKERLLESLSFFPSITPSSLFMSYATSVLKEAVAYTALGTKHVNELRSHSGANAD